MWNWQFQYNCNGARGSITCDTIKMGNKRMKILQRQPKPRHFPHPISRIYSISNIVYYNLNQKTENNVFSFAFHFISFLKKRKKKRNKIHFCWIEFMYSFACDFPFTWKQIFHVAHWKYDHIRSFANLHMCSALCAKTCIWFRIFGFLRNMHLVFVYILCRL